MNYEEIRDCIFEWFMEAENFVSASDLYVVMRTSLDECFENRARAFFGSGKDNGEGEIR